MGAKTRKTLLRQLATKLELIETSPKAFGLKTEELEEMLSEKFEDIADLDVDELKALLDSAETSETGSKGRGTTRRSTTTKKDEDEKPARGRPARGRGRAAKKEEPEEEPEDEGDESEEESEEEPEEETKPKRGRPARGARGRTASKKDEPKDEPEEPEEEPKRGARGRGRGRPAGGKPSRGRGRPAEDEAEDTDQGDDDSPTGSVDLSEIIERLDTIGPLAGKASEQSAKNAKALAEIFEQLNGIVSFLTWQYNETLYDEDGELFDGEEPIESILDTDWSSGD